VTITFYLVGRIDWSFHPRIIGLNLDGDFCFNQPSLLLLILVSWTEVFAKHEVANFNDDLHPAQSEFTSRAIVRIVFIRRTQFLYRVWCWLLVTLLLTQGAAKLKNLTRLVPRRLRYWTVLRMVKAKYWDASALFDQVAVAALLTLPPPACRRLYLIADKTTQQKSGKKTPLAHKTRMN
jgi:hypothetical protein